MKLLAFSIIALALATSALGRILNRCSLAQEMLALGVSKYDLPRWTCIALRESAYNTTLIYTNKNGSSDYGIFQINSQWWCQPPDDRFSHNECHIDCVDLLVDDIKPSVACAIQIREQQGWSAWHTLKFCDGTLPSIDDCFEA